MDIGSHDLRIIQMRNGQIQAFASAAMPDNLVKGGKIIAYNALGDLIRETVKENRLRGGAVLFETVASPEDDHPAAEG